MTLVPAAVVAVAVLAAAGCAPVLAAVGVRWLALPLVPLGGAVVAAVAATCDVAVGGSFLGWFVGLAAVLAVASAAAALRWRPGRDRDPADQDRDPAARDRPGVPGARVVVAAGAGAALVAGVWCLGALVAPTVGFDARAVWLMRSGWFLQPHAQLLFDLRAPSLLISQTSYPPLVSAVAAVAHGVTGNASARLGVVVVAVLNLCALLAAVGAVLACGLGVSRRALVLAPAAAAAAAAPLLVLVSSGVTEPFATNGYADPLWSLAATGALAYGLQLERDRAHVAATALLLVVAGMTKSEGVAVALLLTVLVALRGIAPRDARRRHGWWRPVAGWSGVAAAMLAWPVLMRVIGARDFTTAGTRLSAAPGRARATAEWFAPHLHVLLLALPVAAVGLAVLSGLRRSVGVAHDGWGWAGLVAGLVAIGGSLLIGSADITTFLEAAAHRITEFDGLAGWWIVAVWAVVAAAALGARAERSGPASAAGLLGEPVGVGGGRAGETPDDRP